MHNEELGRVRAGHASLLTQYRDLQVGGRGPAGGRRGLCQVVIRVRAECMGPWCCDT